MTGFIFNSACIVGKIKYLVQRDGGLYYFRMVVPQDLREYFDGRTEIVKSLKTKSFDVAVVRLESLSAQYKNKFSDLRAGGAREQAVKLLAKFQLEDVRLESQKYYIENPPVDKRDLDTPYGVFREYLACKHEEGEGYSKLDPVEKRALEILDGKEELTLREAERHALKYVQNKKTRQSIGRAFALFSERLPHERLNLLLTRHVEDTCRELMLEFKPATVRKYFFRVRKAVEQLLAYRVVRPRFSRHFS